MLDPPSGTVTLLFTDMEGSTRLIQQLGEKYADILATHNQLLGTAFGDAGGHQIGTQGDALFVAFSRARDALFAAVAGQRVLANQPWPPGVTIRVRMGLHTGEPSITEAGYVGLDVHRAARIAAGFCSPRPRTLLSQTTFRLN
jgi:class 3 adenylate cyclase